MKLLHTADWHLGQTFYEYDRREEHQLFFDWLLKQVKTHEVDVLLIAGDVFDTQNPSAESQKMYYSFLRDITTQNKDLQIIIISGNHDSAARLEAPNPLLETMNVTVKGVVRKTTDGEIDYDNLIVPLNNGGVCLAVPYLRQGDYPRSNSYAEGVQAMYTQLIKKAKSQGASPIIAMGHLHATGAEVSEKDNSKYAIVGGLESISPNAFAGGVDYAALGHIHKPQKVAGKEAIRYSGAPIPMSFSEINNKQGVNLITIEKETIIERLEFDTPVKLQSCPKEPKPLAEVLQEIAMLPNGAASSTSPFMEVKVLITEPEPSLRHEIEKALEGKAVRLARLQAKFLRTEQEERKIMTYDELKKIDPLNIAVDIFKHKYGGDDMPEEMKKMFREVINTVKE